MKPLMLVLCIAAGSLAYSQASTSSDSGPSSTTPSSTSDGKPIFPNEFVVEFGLYDFAASPNPVVNASSTMYFSSPLEASRISYSSCPAILAPNISRLACDLYFDKQGTIISAPALGLCCLIFPGVGSVPRDYLDQFSLVGEALAVDYYDNKHTCAYWLAASLGDFAYWTDKETNHPVLYGDSNTGITWQLAAPIDKHLAPSVFAPPFSRCTQACPSDVAQGAVRDPMLRMAVALHKQ